MSIAELTGAEPDTAPLLDEVSPEGPGESAQDLPGGDGAHHDTPAPPASGVGGRPCALVGCPNTLPADAHNRRVYCDDHDGRSPERRKLRRQWIAEHGKAAGSGSDEAPPRVTFEVGKSKGTKGAGEATAAELAAVEQRAKQLTKGLAILMMMGTPDDNRRADAADILGGSDAWAAALRDLAVHEPWLRKMGAGGEVSERGMAWGALLLATGTMALPILMRHEVIKGGMANAVAQLLEQPAPVA